MRSRSRTLPCEAAREMGISRDTARAYDRARKEAS
jgi:hypothetical protein